MIRGLIKKIWEVEEDDEKGSESTCKNIDEPFLYYRFFKDSVARNNLTVGWWRAKVGLKGAWRCKCSPIAYIGVCYPLVRGYMPSFIINLMYKVADKINPRTK